MKKLLALLLALVMVLGMVACATTTTEPEKETEPAQQEETTTEPAAEEQPTASESEETNGLSGEIVFATTFNNVADTTIKALADQFMEENPGTKITVQAIGDAEQELPVMMAGNAMPDIVPVLKSLGSGDYAEYFMPIDDLFTKDELRGYDYGVGTDGHLYGLNSAAQYYGIIYNKTVFANAGITEIPTTMDEFMDACEKIKAIGVVPMASNFKDKWPLGSFIYGMATAHQEVTNVWNEAETSDKLITDGCGIDFIFNFVQEMNEKGYFESDLFSTNWEGSKNDMAAGRFAMMYMASWLSAQIVDQGADLSEIGMFPYPDTKCVISSGDWKYGVSKNSENPELAKAFLKWLWEDGRFAEATGLDCPLVGYSSDKTPWLDELLSYDYPIINYANNSDTVKAIMAEAEYDFGSTMVQDYLVAEDKAAFVEDINARWAAAQQ